MNTSERQQELDEKEKEQADDDDLRNVIVIKLFASCRELIGKDNITIKLKNQITAADLRKEVMNLYPILHQRNQFVVAVNYQIVDEKTPISQKDQVAILPPVSGG